jgi:hypothetical protein
MCGRYGRWSRRQRVEEVLVIEPSCLDDFSDSYNIPPASRRGLPARKMGAQRSTPTREASCLTVRTGSPLRLAGNRSLAGGQAGPTVNFGVGGRIGAMIKAKRHILGAPTGC